VDDFEDWTFVVPGDLIRLLQQREADQERRPASATEARERRIVNRRIEFREFE
jgi:hypothetical protein